MEVNLLLIINFKLFFQLKIQQMVSEDGIELIESVKKVYDIFIIQFISVDFVLVEENENVAIVCDYGY